MQAQRPETATLVASWQDPVARRTAGIETPAAELRRQTTEAASEAWADVEVRDAPEHHPRRRATDASLRPGFPASGFVAQVLAQQAFPPDAVSSQKGLAAYQATLQRGQPLAGPGINLRA